VLSADDDSIKFALHDDDFESHFTFSYQTARLVEAGAGDSGEIVFDGVRDGASLLDYFNENLPTFYTDEFTSLEGFTLHRVQLDTLNPFDPERFETPDWTASGVDITCEFGQPQDGLRSIHAYLEDVLVASDVDVVIYDHGTGEIADFVTLKIKGNETHVALYHCKASGYTKPGERVEDAYEVCGQAAKSTGWAERRRLDAGIVRRIESRPGRSRIAKGDLARVDQALGDGRFVRLVVQIVAVQPGLSKEKLTGKAGAILTAADDFVFGGPCARMRVIGSA
jgi:hypothetical protein